MNADELRAHMESPPEGHKHSQPGRPGLFDRVPDEALAEIHDKALHYDGPYERVEFFWDPHLESKGEFVGRMAALVRSMGPIPTQVSLKIKGGQS